MNLRANHRGAALVDLLIGSSVFVTCTLAITLGAVKALANRRSLIERTESLRSLQESCITLQQAGLSTSATTLPSAIKELEELTRNRIHCAEPILISQQYKSLACRVSLAVKSPPPVTNEVECLLLVE